MQHNRAMRSLLASLALVAMTGQGWADCQTLTATQISQDIQNSPDANDALKNASCTFGGAGVAESGGNSCSSNGNNFGVLQLTRSNLPAGETPESYLAKSPQEQIDIWAQPVGNSNTRGGYQTLAANQTIGGTPVTEGMKAACFQFGPLICRNDIAFMNANGGACPTASNGGVRATGGQNGTLRDGTASLDGNNQSICSWGGAIQKKINDAAATCTNATPQCILGPGGFTPTTTPTASLAPSPSASDVLVGSTQI